MLPEEATVRRSVEEVKNLQLEAMLLRLKVKSPEVVL
jgi:hypothetical protein